MTTTSARTLATIALIAGSSAHADLSANLGFASDYGIATIDVAIVIRIGKTFEINQASTGTSTGQAVLARPDRQQLTQGNTDENDHGDHQAIQTR